jgi:hypothetical protein
MRNERGGGICLELVEKANVCVDARTEDGRSTNGGQGISIKRLRIS